MQRCWNDADELRISVDEVVNVLRWCAVWGSVGGCGAENLTSGGISATFRRV